MARCRATRSFVWTLPLFWYSAACDPDGFALEGTGAPQPTEDEPADERDYPDAEDGSCSAWKFAYCDAIAACSAFETREDCELDLGWLVCNEQAPFAKCQRKIEKALRNDECESLPKDCTPAAIADRTLPRELCRDIHEAMCEHRLFCGLELSLDGCVETLARVEPCDEFTSFLPTAVDCAEAYSVLSCSDPMPKQCAGSLRK